MSNRKPLSGMGVVVTRARSQAGSFAAKLRAYGASVLVCPTIRIVPPGSWKGLDHGIRRLADYDWLIFTSANGAEQFGLRARKLRAPLKLAPGTRTCAIGPATAKAMREQGIPVHKTSKDYVAESVLKAVPNPRGKRILIPRAAVARDLLPKELRRRGAKVEVAEAYRTLPDRSALPRLRDWIRRGRAHCVAFTSSSTARNFFAVLPAADRRKLRAAGAVAASIGPVTTGTLRDLGWRPIVVAGKPTTEHLARSIAQYRATLRRHRGS